MQFICFQSTLKNYPTMKGDFIIYSPNKIFWNSSFCGEWETMLSIPVLPNKYPLGEIASQMN